MADLIKFPHRGHPPRSNDPAANEKDVEYVRAAIEACLPPDALARIAGREMTMAARKAIRRLDEARAGRAQDPTGYDRRQTHGEEDALREMVGPNFDPDAPESA